MKLSDAADIEKITRWKSPHPYGWQVFQDPEYDYQLFLSSIHSIDVCVKIETPDRKTSFNRLTFEKFVSIHWVATFTDPDT